MVAYVNKCVYVCTHPVLYVMRSYDATIPSLIVCVIWWWDTFCIFKSNWTAKY